MCDQNRRDVLMNFMALHQVAGNLLVDRCEQIFKSLDGRIKTKADLLEFYLDSDECAMHLSRFRIGYPDLINALGFTLLSEDNGTMNFCRAQQDLIEVIENYIMENFPGYEFFSTPAILYCGRIRIAILLIDKESLRLANNIDILNETKTIIHSLASTCLWYFVRILHAPHISGLTYESFDSNATVLKKSGQLIISHLFSALYSAQLYPRHVVMTGGPVFREDLAIRLYDMLCALSWMRDESRSNHGELVFLSESLCNNCANDLLGLEFQYPYSVENLKIVRKLLQVSSREKPLYGFLDTVIGFGEKAPEECNNLFRIVFVGQGVWELLFKERIIMRVENSMPRLPKSDIESENIRIRMGKIFGQIEQDAVDFFCRSSTNRL